MSDTSVNETTPFLRGRRQKAYHEEDNESDHTDFKDNKTRIKRSNDDENAVDEKLPFPKSVFFIFSNETCERFSFYGMKAVLSLYLSQLLMRSHDLSSMEAEDLATLLFHTFLFLTYLTPLLGALLADSYIGKFKTILYLSLVYAAGQALLSFGAVPSTPQGIPGLPNEVLSFLGLFLVALGTGGIKPCVVAFGADQFLLPLQKSQLGVYFSIFYACINLGSMFSSFLTPIFRNTACLGDDQCYVLAFGVPAILMLASIIFFVCGRPAYRVLKPSSNVVADFIGCIAHALRSRERHQTHWLDGSVSKYGSRFVSEVKSVLHVCILFIPFPLYWALYDQQGSRWTFQATMMDGRITSNFELLPDQMTVVNTILVLIFIPLFTWVVYPLAKKINFLVKPLQRIVLGGILVGLAFVVSAILQIQLEQNFPHPPTINDNVQSTARLALHASLAEKCDISFALVAEDKFEFHGQLDNDQGFVANNEQGEELLPYLFRSNEQVLVNATFDVSNCTNMDGMSLEDHFFIGGLQSLTVWLTSEETEKSKPSLVLYKSKNEDLVAKPETVGSYVRFLYNLGEENRGSQLQLIKEGESSSETSITIEDAIGDSKAVLVAAPATYEICLVKPSSSSQKQCSVPFELLRGGSFDFFLTLTKSASDTSDALLSEQMMVAPVNSVHLLWMVPQYALLTAGEVLFSITSLAFAFTQAPKRMKSVVQALYLLTNALGNLVDILAIATLSSLFGNQVLEFIFFAVVMFLDMGLLAFLASRYEYVEHHHDDDED